MTISIFKILLILLHFFFHVSMSELFSISIHMHGTGCHTGENESGLDSFSIFEEGKIQYFGCF